MLFKIENYIENKILKSSKINPILIIDKSITEYLLISTFPVKFVKFKNENEICYNVFVCPTGRSLSVI
jgi:hypothetical protein